MTTDKETQYDKDERKFVEITQKLLDNYNINLDDLIDIIKDRCDF